MNAKRILVGGLVAGVVLNILEIISSSLFLGDRYMQLQDKGVFLIEPRYPFMAFWIIMMFLVGIALAWLYAVARPRLGASPKTAVLVGLIVGLVTFVPANFVQASWSAMGRFVPMIWMVWGIVEFVVGTLVAGALYKE